MQDSLRFGGSFGFTQVGEDKIDFKMDVLALSKDTYELDVEIETDDLIQVYHKSPFPIVSV
jgi:hypothetical protein